MAFNSAIIIKPKKLKGTEKVKSSHLQGMEELMPEEANEIDEASESYSPKEKFKVSDKVKQTAFDSINPIKPGNLMGTNKANGETLMSIDLIMQGAKKPKANAYDKETGEFEVPMDEKGKFKESGESAKQKYLNKIKSRKGM
jgi:hypothetical protein